MIILMVRHQPVRPRTDWARVIAWLVLIAFLAAFWVAAVLAATGDLT